MPNAKPPSETVASQLETIEAMLERSKRGFVPLRRVFVQERQRGGGASALAAFVTARRTLALDLYLLVHAIASSPPYDVALPAQVWARALGLHGKAAPSVVSKNWAWLEDQRLIRSEREGRLRRVFLLDEDRSGSAYVHPGEGTDPKGDYFRLPFDYWRGLYMNRLTLPGKAVLLIALSLQLRDYFVLPREQASNWYGISADTIQRGLSELLQRGVVRYRLEYVKAPLSPRGYVAARQYKVFPPLANVTKADAGNWLTSAATRDRPK